MLRAAEQPADGFLRAAAIGAQRARARRRSAARRRELERIGNPRSSGARKTAVPRCGSGCSSVKGLSAEGGRRLVEARCAGAFAAIRDVAERAALGSKDLGALASAGAFKALASNRHRARWEVAGIEKPTELLPSMRFAEGVPMLRRPTESEDIAADYRHLGLTLGRHPLALLRGRLDELRVRSAREVADLEHGTRVRTAGLVITRQRPSSAAGVMFVTLEDETGYVNLVVWDRLAQSERRIVAGAALMGVVGKVQKEGAVLHVIAERLYDHSDLLGRSRHAIARFPLTRIRKRVLRRPVSCGLAASAAALRLRSRRSPRDRASRAFVPSAPRADASPPALCRPR